MRNEWEITSLSSISKFIITRRLTLHFFGCLGPDMIENSVSSQHD
jgi:hypothetical protein